MYKAIISNIRKQEDEITLTVTYSAEGKRDIIKDYSYPKTYDIETNFENTVKMELERLNELETKFDAIEKKYLHKEILATVQKAL